MKINYKMVLAYDGTRFQGWAKQPGVEMTIQGKLESVLSLMAGQPVEVIGAGRTDAGVHAKGMTANFHLDPDKMPEGAPESEREIQDYLNHYLPDDIGVLELKVASDRFHSRYNAVGKTYQYTCYIGSEKPVFDRKYVYCPEEAVDIEKMRQAAEKLIGQHDFMSFCHNPRMKKSTVREVDRIEIKQKGDYLTLTYHGTGFLQYMVRILTGTLLEVGFGKRTPESMKELLEARNRSLAGFTAPAKGLALLKVDY